MAKPLHFLTAGSDGRKLDAGILREATATLSSEEDRRIASHIVEELEMHGRLPFVWTPQEDNFIKLHPQERWLPYLIYRYKFKRYPLERKVADFPIYLLIEPTSVCNLRCTMCFQVDPTFTHSREYMGMMDMGLYRNVIDQAQEGGTQAITLASRGEPTLHKHFGEMLAYASGKFFDLKVNTNATKLTERLSHDILSSDVNELVFSVDANDKDLYEKIRVRGRFEEVLENIVRFRDIREKQYPGSRLSTRICGVKFKPEQDEDAFKKFWSPICDHVAYGDLEARWDTYNNDQHPTLTHSCGYLWERMYVWYDGKVNPCDVDYKSLLSVGNVKDNSIAALWHSPAYDSLRKAHLEGRRSAYLPCDRCGV